MKTNSNDASFPIPYGSGSPGLSKLEYFSSIILAQLSSIKIESGDPLFGATQKVIDKTLCDVAVERAKVLIARLNKES
jgi:hypothetical protein